MNNEVAWAVVVGPVADARRPGSLARPQPLSAELPTRAIRLGDERPALEPQHVARLEVWAPALPDSLEENSEARFGRSAPLDSRQLKHADFVVFEDELAFDAG